MSLLGFSISRNSGGGTSYSTLLSDNLLSQVITEGDFEGLNLTKLKAGTEGRGNVKHGSVGENYHLGLTLKNPWLTINPHPFFLQGS